jgi:amino acid transporter
MMVLPLEDIYLHQGDLLAEIALICGGSGAKILVVIDAVLVLCGGVLAAYVGVSSLLRTLSTDGVLPSYLILTNRRGAAYAAIGTFCTFAISLFLLIFSPHNPRSIGGFGGVFAIAFLCVLLSFVYANFLLKLNRQKLGRLVIAPWSEVWFCLFALSAGLMGKQLLYFSFLALLCGLLIVFVVDCV